MLKDPWREFIPETLWPRKPPFTSGQVIEFTIYHKPMGAPRMTQRDKWQQRPCVMRYRDFKDAIRRDAPPLPGADKIASLSWVAYFVPSLDKLNLIGQIHRHKPDRDNIDKAVLDALFNDDQAIGDGRLTKRWGHEDKIVITITLE